MLFGNINKNVIFYFTLFSFYGLRNTFGETLAQTLEKSHKRLVSDLLVAYNPSLRPSDMVDVAVFLTIEHFNFRESDGAFNFIGRINAQWDDEKLRWNPKDYNNITQIAVHQSLVWIPDLEFFNNAPDKFLRTHRRGFVTLRSNGTVTWQDNVELATFCKTDFIQLPHEKHFCYLHLGTWTHYGTQINLVNNKVSSFGFAENITQSTGYTISSNYSQRATVEYYDVGEKYVSLYFSIRFYRKAECIMILRMHACTVMLLTLATLGLRIRGKHRFGLFGLCLLLITTQLILFVHKVGKFARSTPIIVQFYSHCFILTTLAMLLEVLYSWLTLHHQRNRVLPKFISMLMENPFDRESIVMQWLHEKRRGSDSLLPPNASLPKTFEDLEIFLKRFIFLIYILIFINLTNRFYI